MAPVRHGPALGQFGRERREQRRFDLVVAHAVGQGPGQPGGVGAYQVLEDGRAPRPGAAGDLAHGQARGS
jgi:hypothetical protein